MLRATRKLLLYELKEKKNTEFILQIYSKFLLNPINHLLRPMQTSLSIVCF